MTSKLFYIGKLSNNDNFKYMYSTKEQENLNMYFKMKDKNNYHFEKEEKKLFKYNVLAFIKKYDLIIYPQTSGKMLPEIADILGKETIMIMKNNKETIKELLLTQKLMKAEKKSLLLSFDKMGEDFQINKIKGNQRKRFVNILFQNVNLENHKGKKVLVLDDSIFSGDTLIALLSKVNIEHEIKVLFSKY